MIHQVKTIRQFYKLWDLPEPYNPLIGFVDITTVPKRKQIESGNVVFGFYVISLKSSSKPTRKTNRGIKYYTKGVLGFRTPGQVVKVDPHRIVSSVDSIKSGWMLCIHPDFFLNTTLVKKIRSYDFFNTDSVTPLFLSEDEQATVNTILGNISIEVQKVSDKFSKKITIALIDALLAYVERFFYRQFNINQVGSHTLVDNLNDVLDKHFDNEKLSKLGLPTVISVAKKLNVTPHYLSATLRASTGKNAQQHIHEKIIAKAKELLSSTELSVSEIAFALGFEHLQSFSKLFKTKTQMTPIQFKRSFN